MTVKGQSCYRENTKNHFYCAACNADVV